MLKQRLSSFRTKKFSEKANILVWYIFMMPVFLGAVALAVDMSLITSTQASLQTSLDAATQSTVALSKNQTDGGRPRLTAAEAKASVIKLYDANRSGIYSDTSNSEGVPFLICQNGGTSMVNAPASHCNFSVTSFAYSPTGTLNGGGYLTVSVQEKADTVFLQFLGFNDLTYTLTSTARLTESYN